MRTSVYRSMLFAGAAALALTTGAAFAQGTPQDHGGTVGAPQEHGGVAQPRASQSPSNATTSMGNAGKADHSAQGTNEQRSGSLQQKGAQRNEQGANRSAEENRPGNAHNAQNKNDKGNEQHAQYEKNKNSERSNNQAIRSSEQRQNGITTNNRAERQNPKKNRATAEQRSNQRNATTQQQRAAEQLERNGRLQSNASGVNVKLNDQQRNEIRTTVIDKSGAPRVGHVDFDVAVGTVVPREHVHVVPVPETLVRIEPEWRGYLYFVYEDDVVIVNPHDMKIVAVLAV